MAEPTALFPSQAPGLRWYQRLRLQYCTLSRECRWSWIGLLITITYLMVIHYCLPLVLRLLLHSILLGSSFFGVAYGYAWYVLQQRLAGLDTEEASGFGDTVTSSSCRRAKVIRTKTIPKEPHPQIPQKVFCWLELLDGEEATSGGEEWTKRMDTNIEETNIEEDGNEEEEDEKDWMHVPCVVAQELDATSTEAKIQKGDRITVHTLDGDITRLIYAPYQRIALGRMKMTVGRSLLWAAGACAALALIFKDIPVVFASSQHLEEVLSNFSEKFWGGFEDWLDKVLPDDDDEEDQDIDEDDTPNCRIPWFVAAGYDALLLVQIAVPAGVYLYVRWKIKRSMFEEAPTDSYKLLLGDESEDEVIANNGSALPSPPASTLSASAVVV